MTIRLFKHSKRVSRVRFFILLLTICISMICLIQYMSSEKSLKRYLMFNHKLTMQVQPLPILAVSNGATKPISSMARISTNSAKMTAVKNSSAQTTPPSFTTPTSTPEPNFCPVIQLEPFDPSIMEYLNMDDPPINCSTGTPSLVYLDGDKLVVNITKVAETVGKIDYCEYVAVEQSETDDSQLKESTWSNHFLETPIKIGADEEHLYVQCFQNGTVVGETFKSRVVDKPAMEKKRKADFQSHKDINAPAETMNVVIVGMDGMSKESLFRFMPKTRTFLLERLHAKELHKFNKVGDNTYPNVIVFHTGLSENDLLKEANFTYDQYYDDIDDMFLWHYYQNAGYRTAMGFDVTEITAFHYLKKGWKRPPFDYYNRPLSLAMDFSKTARKGDEAQCVGDIPELTLLHDYLFQVISKNKNSKETPLFLYNFYTHLTHDYQDLATQGDLLYLDLFQKLEKTNALNNTIMIFFSDHGARFGSARQTFNGKIEVNTPFVFFIFPPWFEEKYPEVMKTFRTNQNRLTTFYDMHQTVLELLTFNGQTNVGSLDSVGISLFDEIPVERTCLEANIPLEYCNCLKLENKTVSKNTTQALAKHLLQIVVERTANERDKCATLKLQSVPSILVAQTDAKGKNNRRYQIVIETTPGGGLYEALMEFSKDKREANLVGAITRVNHYKGQDTCMSSLDLKSFCFCKS